MSEALLQLEGVRTHFPLRGGFLSRGTGGAVKAVDGVDLAVDEGEILGLVGESGCGKSTLARTVLQLVPPTEGAIRFEGQRLDTLSPRALRAVRPRLQMVFQDPYASLNPRMTVFDAIAEPMLAHRIASRRDAAHRVADLMGRVGLAARYMRKYPHEFSGGQRQRIAVARALAMAPRLIVADEPVSALDVSVQAQILNLLARLRRESGLALVLIAHDLSVVRHISDRTAVMYLGRIVEAGPAEDVFDRPRHPYSMALASAVPLPDPVREKARRRVLLRGEPPSPLDPPPGCPFHPRCPCAEGRCAEEVPRLEEIEPGRAVSCLRVREIHEDL